MNRSIRYVLLALSTTLCMMAPNGRAQDADPFTRLFDTGTPSPEAIQGKTIAERTGWIEIPEDTTDHAFQGDAAFLNDRIAVVLRKGSPGPEIYAANSGQMSMLCTLRPLAEADPGALSGVSIERNAPDSVEIVANFGSLDIAGLRIELALGQVFVKLQAIGATSALHVVADSEFAVLPDFFADDIVIAASDLSVDRAEVPSENFLLQLAQDGNAIVGMIWDNRDQDVRINLAERGGHRRIESSEIAFGEAGSIHVAALAQAGIWHRQDVTPADKGRIIDLGWSAPFPAIWRVDWRTHEQLTDSWEMAIENPDGSFRKSDLFEVSNDTWTDQDWWSSDRPRRRWNTGLGGYLYPCWFDREGKGFLQPLKPGRGASPEAYPKYEGPAIIYAINRNSETPNNVFTLTDLVRGTLGMGPCQYILDVEGQDLEFKGRPTCDVRDTLNPIYEQGDQVRQEAEVKEALDNVLAFMRLIRGRIEQYRAFGEEMSVYLAKVETEDPELSAFVQEMLKFTGKIQEVYDRRAKGIRSPEDATSLVDQFRNSLVGYTGADAATRCKELTSGFVGIGDNQDELVAECRLAVKLLRQRAALAMAQDPSTSEVVRKIRERTQAVLRDPVNYEAARH